MHRCRCTGCRWWPHGSVTWGRPCSGLFSFTGSRWSAEELCACSPNAQIHHLQFLKPAAMWTQLTAAQPIRQLVEEEESKVIRSVTSAFRANQITRGAVTVTNRWVFLLHPSFMIKVPRSERSDRKAYRRRSIIKWKKEEMNIRSVNKFNQTGDDGCL